VRVRGRVVERVDWVVGCSWRGVGGGGGELPRRYFRDPLKRSIKGCKSFKEKQNAAMHEGVGSDFWNIEDVLYEVYPHTHANMYV